MLSTKYVFKSYLIYIFKHNLELNDLQWLICHKTNQPTIKIGITISFLLVLAFITHFLSEFSLVT